MLTSLKWISLPIFLVLLICFADTYYTPVIYKVGDCFQFLHNDYNVFKVKDIKTYRYVVNDNKYLSIKFVNKMSTKVKCVDKF